MHIVILLYLGFIPKLLISRHKWFKSRVASKIQYLQDFGNSSHKWQYGKATLQTSHWEVLFLRFHIVLQGFILNFLHTLIKKWPQWQRECNTLMFLNEL
jgi:hypothetical protein